jgi:hypothetical protein
MEQSDKIIASLPPEIWTKVFRILRCIPKPSKYKRSPRMTDEDITDRSPTESRKVWLSRESDMDMRDGSLWLVPVICVCRLWNTIAIEILYEEIDAKSSYP